MALEDKATLWSKLNSNLVAEIGPNGAWVGTPAYNDCKFDKGTHSDNVANYPTFPDASINENKFQYEVWFKAMGWTCTNGDPSDGVDKGLFGWWVSSSNWIQCHFSASSNAFFLRFRIGGATVNFISSDAAFTFGDGVLQHILMVYDQTGIAGGADICRIYFNGVLVFNSSLTPLTQPNGPGLYIQNAYKGTSVAGPFKGCIDNTKIYSTVDEATILEILANRENEGWPAPVPITTHLLPKVAADLVNNNTGAWYHQKLELTAGTWTDAYLFPVYGAQKISARVEGDGALWFTTDEAVVIEAGLADWVEWTGVDPINMGFRAVRMERTSGTVTGKITIKTGTA